MNRVDVLFVGYSKSDPSNNDILNANCTCSLIRTCRGLNIIVDTRTAWDGTEITEALKKYGIACDKINFVVCTHGHSDHIGCNYLFQKAQYHFVGRCASNRNCYLGWDGSEPYLLDGEDVTIHYTPGHTHSCITVIVKKTLYGTIGICGDLFERFEDIENPNIWLSAGSENNKMQRKFRHSIAQQCDYILPGHGPGFVVTDDIRNKLLLYLNDCG